MKFEQTKHAEINALCDDFRVVNAGHGTQKAMERIEQCRTRLKEGVFRIAVVGEIKKGKSSLINALIGADSAAPTASDVATSVVYKLVWGQDVRAVIHFVPEVDKDGNVGATPPPRTVPLEDLPQWGTEDGNPGNRKRVDHICIDYPSPWLKRGIEIIDTPGLGGLFKHHALSTWAHVPSADAVFFALDSVEAVMSADEVEFLKKIQPVTRNITFFQTKIDLVGTENWQAWRERNLDIIAEAIGKPKTSIPYFAVSSKLKKAADATKNETILQRSGFIEVNEYLNQDLLQQKERELSGQIGRMIHGEARTLRQQVQSMMELSSTEGKQKSEEIEREIKEAIAEHENWGRTRLRDELDSMRDQITDLKTSTRNHLLEELDSSSNGPVVSEIMSFFEGREDITPEQLNQNVAQVQNACTDKCGQIIVYIQRRFNEEAEQVIDRTLRNLGSSKRQQLPQNRSGNIMKSDVKVVHSLGMRDDVSVKYEQMRNTVGGGLMATAALTMIFGPLGLLGTVVTFLGGLFASIFANESWKERRRAEAIAKLKTIVSQTVDGVRRMAMQEFDRTAVEIERRARNSFNDASDEVLHRLRKKNDELTANRTRSSAETSQRIASLKGDLVKIDSVIERSARLAK